MPTDFSGDTPGTLHEVMRQGRGDNITIPTIGATTTEIGGKTIERDLLSAIIRPRIEEIIELPPKSYCNCWHGAHSRKSFVLTGGASQLTGLADLFC